jgi:hypothetical protein
MQRDLILRAGTGLDARTMGPIGLLHRSRRIGPAGCSRPRSVRGRRQRGLALQGWAPLVEGRRPPRRRVWIEPVGTDGAGFLAATVEIPAGVTNDQLDNGAPSVAGIIRSSDGLTWDQGQTEQLALSDGYADIGFAAGTPNEVVVCDCGTIQAWLHATLKTP